MRMTTVPAGSSTGSSARARPSIAGAGSAAKSGIERSSAISTTGTFALRSTAIKGRASSAASTGRSSPAPSRAAFEPPSATSGGISSAPSARPAISRPSSTPKTRPSTSDGVVRCTSVRQPTSSTSRPAPLSVISSTAEAVERDRWRQVAAPDQRHRGETAEHAARRERGIEVSDPALPEVEDVEGEHDEEDVDRPPEQELAHQQAHEQSQVRVLPERSEAGKRLGRAAILAAGERWRRAVHPHNEQCGDEQKGSHEPEDEVDAGDGQKDAGERTGQQHPSALHPPRHDVRRGELLCR